MSIGILGVELQRRGYLSFTNNVPVPDGVSKSIPHISPDELFVDRDGCATFSRLEFAFAMPEKVCRLELTEARVNELGVDINRLVNMQYLDISKTRVTRVPGELGDLTELREITIRTGQLSAPELNKIKDLLPDITVITK